MSALVSFRRNEPARCNIQARREGERKVFLGPATFWGLPHRSKILKKVLQVASFSNMYEIHFRWGFRPRPRCSGEKRRLRRSPRPPNRMVRVTPLPVSPYLSTPSASGSRPRRNEVDVGHRKNGFLGPAAALNGSGNITNLQLCVYRF